FLGDRDHEAQVGFNQLALRGFSVNVALDDFALRAPQFLIADAAIGLKLFQIVAVLPLDAPVLALSLLNPRRLDFFFQIVDLAIERTHGVDRFDYAVDQSLALRVGELQLADSAGNLHVCASQGPADLARLFRFLLG